MEALTDKKLIYIFILSDISIYIEAEEIPFKYQTAYIFEKITIDNLYRCKQKCIFSCIISCLLGHKLHLFMKSNNLVKTELN